MERYALVLLACAAAPLFGQAAAEAVLNRGTTGAKASAVAPIGRTAGNAASRDGMDAPRAGGGKVSRTQGGTEMLVFDPARRNARSRTAAPPPAPPRNYEPLTLASLKVGMDRNEIIERFGPPNCAVILSDLEVGEEQLAYTTPKGEFIDIILRGGKIVRILPSPQNGK